MTLSQTERSSVHPFRLQCGRRSYTQHTHIHEWTFCPWRTCCSGTTTTCKQCSKGSIAQTMQPRLDKAKFSTTRSVQHSKQTFSHGSSTVHSVPWPQGQAVARRGTRSGQELNHLLHLRPRYSRPRRPNCCEPHPPPHCQIQRSPKLRVWNDRPPGCQRTSSVCCSFSLFIPQQWKVTRTASLGPQSSYLAAIDRRSKAVRLLSGSDGTCTRRSWGAHQHVFFHIFPRVELTTLMQGSHESNQSSLYTHECQRENVTFHEMETMLADITHLARHFVPQKLQDASRQKFAFHELHHLWQAQ